MATVFEGATGRLRIGEPRLFVDNRARFRSGHMSCVMHGRAWHPGDSTGAPRVNVMHRFMELE